MLHYSGKVTCLDGGITNQTIDFISGLDTFIVLENEIKKDKRHFIFWDEKKKFDELIEQDLIEGKNIVIVSMSSEVAKEYNEMYKNKYKTVFHYSKSDDTLKTQLKDVTTLWKVHQLIIFSPAIESGVNYNIKHIDNMYVILSSHSTSVSGLLQMMNRVRQLNNDNINVFLNKLRYSENSIFWKFEEIENHV